MKGEKLEQLVFTFGCPRSGTTFLQMMMMAGTGYEVYKIPEYAINHPGMSHLGLITLKQMFYDKDVVFVRIVRDPAEIIKSYYAARDIVENNRQEVIQSHSPDVERIASHSDYRILQTIITEQENTMKQAGAAGEKGKVEIITIKYETMDINELWPRLVKPEQNRELLQNFIDKHWNKIPLRGGRLSYGVEVALPGEVMEKLKEI